MMPKEHLNMDPISFHNALAKKWSIKYKKSGLRKRYKFFSAHLKPFIKKNSFWFDAGCGTGILSRKINQYGAQVVAVDGSKEMIRMALKETEKNKRIKYINSDLVNFDFESIKNFDGIICSSVIEYLDNPETILMNFYNQLNKNGHLIFSVPNESSLVRNIQIALRNLFKCFKFSIFNYLQISKNSYTFRELNDFLATFGFTDYKIYKFDAIIPDTLHKVFQPTLYVVFAKK